MHVDCRSAGGFILIRPQIEITITFENNDCILDGKCICHFMGSTMKSTFSIYLNSFGKW